MQELDIKDCRAALKLIGDLSVSLPQTPELAGALSVLQAAVEELDAWKKLKDPKILHANLLAGKPAKLSNGDLLHLAGAGECSNVGGCIKKLAGEDKAGCLPDHLLGVGDHQVTAMPVAKSKSHASVKPAGVSSISDEEVAVIAAWFQSEEGHESLRQAADEADKAIERRQRDCRVDSKVWRTAIGPRSGYKLT